MNDIASISNVLFSIFIDLLASQMLHVYTKEYQMICANFGDDMFDK